MKSLLAVFSLVAFGNAAFAESAAVRDSKPIGLGLKYGMVAGLIPGAGGEVFYGVNSSLQIGALYHSGSLDLKSAVEGKDDYSTIGVSKAEIDASLALVQARFFFGNSFFLGAGVGQRKIGAEYGLIENTTETSVNGKVKVTSTVMHFSLGNVWAFDSGFYIGADWLSYTVAASSKYSATTKVSGSLSSELQDLQDTTEDLGKSLGKASTLQLLVLQLGWMF